MRKERYIRHMIQYVNRNISIIHSIPKTHRRQMTNMCFWNADFVNQILEKYMVSGAYDALSRQIVWLNPEEKADERANRKPVEQIWNLYFHWKNETVLRINLSPKGELVKSTRIFAPAQINVLRVNRGEKIFQRIIKQNANLPKLKVLQTNFPNAEIDKTELLQINHQKAENHETESLKINYQNAGTQEMTSAQESVKKAEEGKRMPALVSAYRTPSVTYDNFLTDKKFSGIWWHIVHQHKIALLPSIVAASVMGKEPALFMSPYIKQMLMEFNSWNHSDFQKMAVTKENIQNQDIHEPELRWLYQKYPDARIKELQRADKKKTSVSRWIQIKNDMEKVFPLQNIMMRSERESLRKHISWLNAVSVGNFLFLQKDRRYVPQSREVFASKYVGMQMPVLQKINMLQVNIGEKIIQQIIKQNTNIHKIKLLQTDFQNAEIDKIELLAINYQNAESHETELLQINHQNTENYETELLQINHQNIENYETELLQINHQKAENHETELLKINYQNTGTQEITTVQESVKKAKEGKRMPTLVSACSMPSIVAASVTGNESALFMSPYTKQVLTELQWFYQKYPDARIKELQQADKKKTNVSQWIQIQNDEEKVFPLQSIMMRSDRESLRKYISWLNAVSVGNFVFLQKDRWYVPQSRVVVASKDVGMQMSVLQKIKMLQVNTGEKIFQQIIKQNTNLYKIKLLQTDFQNAEIDKIELQASNHQNAESHETELLQINHQKAENHETELLQINYQNTGTQEITTVQKSVKKAEEGKRMPTLVSACSMPSIVAASVTGKEPALFMSPYTKQVLTELQWFYQKYPDARIKELQQTDKKKTNVSRWIQNDMEKVFPLQNITLQSERESLRKHISWLNAETVGNIVFLQKDRRFVPQPREVFASKYVGMRIFHGLLMPQGSILPNICAANWKFEKNLIQVKYPVTSYGAYLGKFRLNGNVLKAYGYLAPQVNHQNTGTQEITSTQVSVNRKEDRKFYEMRRYAAKQHKIALLSSSIAASVTGRKSALLMDAYTKQMLMGFHSWRNDTDIQKMAAMQENMQIPEREIIWKKVLSSVKYPAASYGACFAFKRIHVQGRDIRTIILQQGNAQYENVEKIVFQQNDGQKAVEEKAGLKWHTIQKKELGEMILRKNSEWDTEIPKAEESRESLVSVQSVPGDPFAGYNKYNEMVLAKAEKQSRQKKEKNREVLHEWRQNEEIEVWQKQKLRQLAEKLEQQEQLIEKLTEEQKQWKEIVAAQNVGSPYDRRELFEAELKLEKMRYGLE